MELSAKKYTVEKTKKYIKINSLFIFFNGINRNSSEWIIIEQNLKKINFNSYKIFNKISKKTLNSSVFNNTCALINSVTLFLKPILINKEITKYCLLYNFEHMLFYLLALKLNNKIYSKNQLKDIYSFNYKDNKLLFFKFLVSNTKIIIK